MTVCIEALHTLLWNISVFVNLFLSSFHKFLTSFFVSSSSISLSIYVFSHLLISVFYFLLVNCMNLFITSFSFLSSLFMD